ncbi:MAG: glycosyltransferase family 39 protein, partial [Chloroflexota bacterium]|nr:glycosyltransferase family 39 protein [Chloroflexota bacterium]
MINEKIVSFIKEKNFYIVVTAISIIGFLLRFYGINWDNGLLFHPDERQLLMISSQMNLNNLDPGWYNYGTFPLYLLEFFSLNSEWNIYELRFPGRILSSIFDSSTIIISGLIGRKLYSNITGILASFFYSICVLAIQTSHFFVVDTFLTFFTTLIIFYCIKLNEKLTVKRTVIVGILFGISLTIKISSALILGIILIVIIFNINSSKGRLNDLLKYYILVLFSSFLTFFILNPFSLINYSDFLLASKTQSDMARGLIDFPYTRQYINTTPYIYHLIQIVKTSLGPIAGLIGIFSILFAFRKLEINN